MIGSVLLLQSKRAVPTVLSFAGGFLAGALIGLLRDLTPCLYFASVTA